MSHSERDALVDLLETKGITHPAVLNALRRVPRDQYLLPVQSDFAYQDNPLPIACGQTISQPYIVAYMTQLLLQGAHPVNNVLEIGTGSGYQAAILSECIPTVFTIERIAELYQSAKAKLTKFYPDKMAQGQLQCRFGDGALGWPEQAPFDAIIVTAGAQAIPLALLDQLADQGRCVLPIGEPERQFLEIITRQGNDFTRQRSECVRFVPLLGGTEGLVAE